MATAGERSKPDVLINALHGENFTKLRDEVYTREHRVDNTFVTLTWTCNELMNEYDFYHLFIHFPE